MKKMSCRKASILLDRRDDGILTEAEAARLTEHLHTCPSCRAYEAENEALKALLQRACPIPSEGFSERVMNATIKEGRGETKAFAIPTPWYRRPATRKLVTAALVLVMGASLMVSPLVLSMRQKDESPEETVSGTQVYAPEGEAPFYIRGQGMRTDYPWAYLMSPPKDPDEEHSDGNGTFPDSGFDIEGILPEDTAPEADAPSLPECEDTAEGEEPETDSGDWIPEVDGDEWKPEVTVMPDNDHGDMVTLEPEESPEASTDDQYLVRWGERVTLTLTVKDEGTALWQGTAADGASVRFACDPDGGYRLSLDGRLVSAGEFCGFKDGYLLLSDRQCGGIALAFVMNGNRLVLEVPAYE